MKSQVKIQPGVGWLVTLEKEELCRALRENDVVGFIRRVMSEQLFYSSVFEYVVLDATRSVLSAVANLVENKNSDIGILLRESCVCDLEKAAKNNERANESVESHHWQGEK